MGGCEGRSECQPAAMKKRRKEGEKSEEQQFVREENEGEEEKKDCTLIGYQTWHLQKVLDEANVLLSL